MSCLDNLSGCELVTLASIIAIAISEGKTSDEIGTLGNFFSALGDNLNILSSSSGNNTTDC